MLLDPAILSGEMISSKTSRTLVRRFKYLFSKYAFAMYRRILGMAIAGLIVIAFMVPASVNIEGLTSGESVLLSKIFTSTTVALNKLTLTQNTLQTINDDLQLKKKFWQFEPKSERNPDGWIVSGHSIGVRVQECNLPDQTACAFNVESIQFSGVGSKVAAIIVDGVRTDISGDNIAPATNLLLDTGIGKIGASRSVLVEFDDLEGYLGPVEFNGEKPQGVQLCTFGEAVQTGGNECTP